jgi:energy-coupling factor transporter transmembrane protein EcfT
MQQLFHLISSNPIYAIITFIIVIVLVFFVIKKMFKLVLYAVLVFLCFLGYVYFTGGDIKDTINKTKGKSEDVFK